MSKMTIRSKTHISDCNKTMNYCECKVLEYRKIVKALKTWSYRFVYFSKSCIFVKVTKLITSVCHQSYTLTKIRCFDNLEIVFVLKMRIRNFDYFEKDVFVRIWKCVV